MRFAPAAILFGLGVLGACPSPPERAQRSLREASDLLFSGADPATALALYEDARERSEPGSQVWHSARWWRLHALAEVEPTAVAAELERLLREDAAGVSSAALLSLAERVRRASEPAAAEVLERGMALLGLPEQERAGYRARLSLPRAEAGGPR